MPRLRFTRDQRGYENTFLVHTTRRRGKERTRILYWFRSPPHVKVGRAAFDEEAIRAIEEANPDIAFDWGKILEARPAEPEFEPWRTRRGREGRNRERPDTSGRSAVPPPARESRQPERRALAEPLSDEEPDSPVEEEDAGPATALEPSAAEEILGAEGLSRVRARYAEVLARISAQVTDDAAAEELRGLAERLNPDAWVTADEVGLGLEDFERVLEQVRQRLGAVRRPRRDARLLQDAIPGSDSSSSRNDASPQATSGPEMEPED